MFTAFVSQAFNSMTSVLTVGFAVLATTGLSYCNGQAPNVAQVLNNAQLGKAANQEEVVGTTAEKATTLKFVTDDFFAAAYLDLDGILNSKSYQDLPFDTFIPSSVLFERYRNTPVKELAVLLKKGSDLEPQIGSGFEVAISATLDKALSSKLDLATFERAIAVRPVQSKLPIKSFKIGSQECYQVPSGTFLNARRKLGLLTFFGKDGVAQDGIHAGNFSYRYITSKNKSHVRFKFENLEATDLRDEKLILKIWLDTIKTFVSPDPIASQIFLQRCDKSLTSTPIDLDAIASTELEVAFPRKLTAKDQTGELREVDLIDDLVADGCLDIVIKCKKADVYLGFEPPSVSIDTGAVEFVTFQDKTMLITQSLPTLKKMLEQDTESTLGKRLKQTGQELSVVVDVKGQPERESLGHFIDLISLDEVQTYIPKIDFSVAGGLGVSNLTSGQLRISLPNANQAKRLHERLLEDVTVAKRATTTAIIKAIRTQCSLDNLAGTMFKWQPQFPDTKVDRIKFEQHASRLIAELFNSLKIEQRQDLVQITFTETEQLTSKSRRDQLALAAIEFYRVRELFLYNSQYISDRLHERITHRLPHSQGAWLRRAHQNSYNISMNFDPTEVKYDWVRRGINVLLDGAEQNPESMDLVWATAFYIGYKVGSSDERRVFQELFAKDDALHQRLKPFINLENARSEDGRIESWLVAQQIFQFCADNHQDNINLASEGLFYSQPARMHAGYALSLSERGEFDQALKHWAKAEKLLLTAQIQIQEKLSDDVAEEEPAGRIEKFHASFFGVDLKYWIWRSKFEQSEAGSAIRKLEYDARLLVEKMGSTAAFEIYESAMELIAGEINSHPENTDFVFRTAEGLVKKYLTIEKKTQGKHDESIQETIEMFNQYMSRRYPSWKK